MELSFHTGWLHWDLTIRISPVCRLVTFEMTGAEIKSLLEDGINFYQPQVSPDEARRCRSLGDKLD